MPLLKGGKLHITGVTTPLPHLIGAVEAKLKATVVVAQRFCSLLVCGYGRKNNEFFVAAFAASLSSSQNRCVVTPNVMCNAPDEGAQAG